MLASFWVSLEQTLQKSHFLCSKENGAKEKSYCVVQALPRFKMAWVIALVFAALAIGFTEQAKTFRWCAFDKEMAKCEEFVKIIPTLANATNVQGMAKGSCVKVKDDTDCMKKIKAKEADFITLDGGMVYIAGKDYGLVPIVGELTGDSLGYYGVAVAKKNTDVTLKTLKGKKTCHTGYGKTAGWNLPVGWLLQQDGFRTGCGDHIDAQSASKYFKESCVPGIPAEYGNLCALCPQKNCKKENNAYGGYTGAFKCMMDGKGDVAFVKHLTTSDVVGNDTSGYKYLCTDGTDKVVTPTSHEKCNLAQSVSHTVVARNEDNKDVVKILVKAAEVCQPNKTAASCGHFLLFESKKYGGSNLLFKDKATALQDVGDKNTYTKWLGDDYTKDIEEIKKKGSPCAKGSILAGLPTLILAMLISTWKMLGFE